jgi:FMN-dependent NADH-azoreductase
MRWEMPGITWAPLYNYGLPSSLKAWIDQISVSGRTIHLPDGPVTAGRPAVVVSSRGGSYGSGEPHEGRDHLVPNLREILAVDMGLEMDFITSSWGLAEVLPMMAGLIPVHRESRAAAHSQARRLGESFALRDVGEVPRMSGSRPAASFTVDS